MLAEFAGVMRFEARQCAPLRGQVDRCALTGVVI